MSSRNNDRDGGIAGDREKERVERRAASFTPPPVLSTLAAVAPRLSWRWGERE
jgi:hypothetical protein